MKKVAVFLDRDGVLTEPVFDPNRNVYRAPWSISEFKLMPLAVESLIELRNGGYYLFLVSNQPDAVKKLVGLERLIEIKYHLINILAMNKVFFKEHCYCFHHPSKEKCECRKPSPFFLLEAVKEYHIDLKNSWMIGDRSTDIECGRNAGTKTILIGNDKKRCVGVYPNYIVNNIKEAVDVILSE